jgi:hypothetical protein
MRTSLIMIFLLGMSSAMALECSMPKPFVIGSFDQGVLQEGFAVNYRLAGNDCDTIPYMRDLSEGEYVCANAFDLDGLGQIDGDLQQCNRGELSGHRIINEPDTLVYAQQKEYWEKSVAWEQWKSDALRRVVAGLIIVATLGALVFAWLGGETPVPWRIVKAVAVQVVLLAVLLFAVPVGKYSFLLWRHAHFWSIAALALAIIVELSWFFYRRYQLFEE